MTHPQPAAPIPAAETLSTVRDETGQVTSTVRRTTLPSGLRIVTEQMAGVRSAALGVWVGVGSRDEDDAHHGCSHFLEHLLFKGTPERSALDLSIALDEVGGEVNAFTAKELTCFYARVLGQDLPLAIDVFGDMLTSSVVTEADVEAEREVILDEIAMHDDDPEDVVHELFAEQAWGGGSPLGRPIAGTTTSIEAMERDRIVAFYRRYYRPQQMVVAAAGQLDHDTVVADVVTSFARGGFLAGSATPLRRTPTGRPPVHAGEVSTNRGFEQVNVVLGHEGVARGDERRFALAVLNAALGGGTSSRLFQEVRERRGLAYSVYSFDSQYTDSGLVGVTVGCLPAKLEEVLTTVRLELSRVAAQGISAEELARGQGQLRGGLVLGLEDSASRMDRLGKAELMHGEFLEIDELIARIDGVTVEQVAQVAAEIFARREIVAVVGPQ